MRERCPVAHSDFLGWSLFRQEDLIRVLADTDTFSNTSQFMAIPNGLDPPIHNHYREALDPNFDRETLRLVEPLIRGIAKELMVLVPSLGDLEFISSFVTPFSMKSLCIWLGWPLVQWESLEGWVQGSQHAAFKKDPIAGKTLADFFSKKVKANLDKHRSEPDRVPDATDALLDTEVDGVRLNDDQIVSVLRNWTAGHGTMAGGLSILVQHLAQDNLLQDRLRNNFLLIPMAIEEILRSDGPLVANPRTTTRNVTIQGRSIPKGEHVTMMWMAANRDSRVFEDPTTVKLERNTESSLVWGQGVHLCQGAPLARLEMRIALEELLIKTKRFELADEEIGHRDVYPSNGYSSLVLRLR